MTRVLDNGEASMIIPKCPECKSENVAWIFWGYPCDMDWWLQAVEKKEIVPGGCIVTDHDPEWECNECGRRWGHREDD
jgi:hypothetical protein